MLERINLRKAKNFIPLAGASLALIFLFALSFSYGSRPPRKRSLTKSPLLWAKFDGNLTDEVSSGSSFAYSPGKPSTASGISLKEGDNIQYGPGAAIDAGSDVYENWNPNQGTMNVWVEPSWAGNDNEAHWIWSADAGRIDTADANLVAYWKFDEGSENFASDSSSNSNVGYLHGPALSFDGGDYVSVPNTASFGGNALTFTAWVKHSSLSQNQAIFTQREGGEPVKNNWQVYTSVGASDVLYFSFWKSNVEFTCTSDDSIAVDKWEYVTVTFDGSTVLIYKNGTQVHSCSLSGPIDNDSSKSYIGSYNGSGEFLYGSIDEVRIYNRALSATEVGQHYVGNFADESGLVGYWDMDENQGQTVADSSGNSNNGTLGADSGSSTDDPTWVNYAPRWTEEGRFGEAVVFDGSDDEIEFGDINF